MTETLAGRVRLGTFELDLKAGELRQGGRKVVLQEQPFQVLRLLVEHNGELVTREVIQKRLWPNDTIVEFDHSINTAIKKLRAALGDSADEPKYIETVGRRGYRLVVPVERLQSSASDVAVPSAASSGGDEIAMRAPLDSSGLTGKTVSHYRVLDVLGGGGMGVVYRAEDIRLGRAVALKFLPEDVARNPRALERFDREARAASALEHPNICPIYEFGEHEGQPFIVMQLLQGETLRGRLATLRSDPAQPKAMALDEILDVAIQITTGLQAAHEKAIIHRDIKPANIFVSDKGEVKILDFGLAKLAEAGEQEARPAAVDAPSAIQPPAVEGPAAVQLSRPGVVLGTAAYMSPEQVRGEKLDSRTDLFSFGLVLYEMATGRQAFAGGTVEALQEAILKLEPAPARQLNPNVPPRLAAMISRCLRKNREDRYQRAAEIRSGLEEVKRETTRPVGRWAALVAAAVVVAGLVAGGFYWRSREATPLTGKDTVVLADFENKTGDTVFDGTLRQGLSSQLEQSSFLELLSDKRIGQTLSLMAQPKDTRLTSELAREVCQRTGSAATIEGSISTLGSQYVVGLRAVSCRNGELLASSQETANSKEQVLKALGDGAAKLRRKLGESLASVQKYDAPAENVTTPSLEALQAYSLGYRAMMVKNDHPSAIPLLQRAISLDPNFAMAYARLATSYRNQGQTARAAENLRKAYELRDRVSEREKFYIDAHYAQMVSGNLEAARRAYELWAQTYPRDPVPPNNLGNIYVDLGEYGKALAAYQAALNLDPENGLSHGNLAQGYLYLNRLEEAKATAHQAQSKNLDSTSIRSTLYLIAFLQRDLAGMEREATALANRPGIHDTLYEFEANTAVYAGQFGRGRELTRYAINAAQRADKNESAAAYQAMAAIREALVGNPEPAKQEAESALASFKGKDVEAVSAIALALAGDSARASRLATDLATQFPDDTLVQFNYLPTIRALVALRTGDPAKAVEALSSAAPYELGTTDDNLPFSLYPVYARGEAYLAAGQGPAAAGEFRKVLDHPGVAVNQLIGALARLGLGRAYALSGDATNARTAYQEFLALWKNTDADIPILKQAKAEYANLR